MSQVDLEFVRDCVAAVAPNVSRVTVVPDADLVTDLGFNSLMLLDLSFEIERRIDRNVDLRAVVRSNSGKAKATMRVAELLQRMQTVGSES
jgi:acyl carrier protein